MPPNLNKFAFIVALHQVIISVVPTHSLQQCILCRKNETNFCIRDDAVAEEQVVTLWPSAPVISLRVSVSAEPSFCWLTVSTPAHPERLVNLTTNNGNSSGWNLRRSDHFTRFAPLIFFSRTFTNKSGEKANLTDFVGLYAFNFAQDQVKYFYINLGEEADEVSAKRSIDENDEDVVTVSQTETFRKCRSQIHVQATVEVTCNEDDLEPAAAAAAASNSFAQHIDDPGGGGGDLSFPYKPCPDMAIQCSLPGFGVISKLWVEVEEPAISQGSVGLVSSASVLVIVVATLIIGVILRRKHRQKSLATSQKVNQVVVVLPGGTKCSQNGARLTVPEPMLTPPTRGRQRLSSILSYFSNSSSSGMTSNATESASSCEDLALLPVPGVVPDWMKDRLFSFDSLKLSEQIGHGEYGVVFKAMVLDGTARWPVALKAAKMDDSERFMKAQEDLMKEGEVMAALPYHENIANLQGVALQDGRIARFFLMIEFCGNGSLNKYLRSNKDSIAEGLHRCRFYCSAATTITVLAEEDEEVGQGNAPEMGVTSANCQQQQQQHQPPKLRNNTCSDLRLMIGWCHQIAKGMDFLTSRGIVHGDLATRNVLLTDDLTAKICDFGLSHLLQEEKLSASLRQTRLPECWMAPEVFYSHSVTKYCDVWSFGITMWEIFALGEVPYKALKLDSSVTFLDALQRGVRLSRPQLCPKEIYDLMSQCWVLQPEERISFQGLCESLDRFLDAGYNLRYQEAREEMLKRYTSIQQNLLYFRMNGGGGGGVRDEGQRGDYYVESQYVRGKYLYSPREDPSTASTVITVN